MNRIIRLRESQGFRDFVADFNDEDGNTISKIPFNITFVDFLKDNYSECNKHIFFR